MTAPRLHARASTRSIAVVGDRFAYRELGPTGGVPVVLLNHLAANLDNWDPRVVDGLAAERHVVTVDYRGVGDSSGRPSDSIEAMASDMIAVVRALGHERIDLLGMSMGGMVAQSMMLQAPELVRRAILAGTGPAGGIGIDRVPRVSNLDVLRAALTATDPKEFLFFTRTPSGKRAAKEFITRLKERTVDRDRPVTLGVYRSQLRAVQRWGVSSPHDLSVIGQPVLIVNGESDRMVPSINSAHLAQRIPDSRLVLWTDAGHGGAFERHTDFVPRALDFLR